VPPVTLLPRFWSQQGQLRIQACGITAPATHVAVTRMRPHRRDTARSGVLASFYQQDTMCGLIAVNAPHAFTATTRVLLHDTPHDVIVQRGVDHATGERSYVS